MAKQKTLLFLRLIFCFLVVTPCSAQKNEIVLINKSSNGELWGFSYWKDFSTIPTNHREIWGDKSKPSITIPTETPLFFNFSWNFKIQPVYLFPGDTLEFNVTESDSLPFVFGGTRPYNELMFFSILEVSKLGFMSSGNQQIEITNQLNFQYLADETLNRYKARLEFLAHQSTKGKFSSEGYRAIAQSLYYQYLGELFFPYHSSRPIEDIFEKNKIVPDFYKEKLFGFENEILKDSLTYLWDYRRFIRYYARFLMVERSDAEAVGLGSLLNFYKRTFNGKIRNLLLFDEVYSNYRKTGDASYIEEVIDSIKNQTIRDTLILIQKKSNQKFSQYALKVKIESSSGKTYTLKELLDSHFGKLVYLDFWATWCAPCLLEMPDSKKLTEEFKSENIAFIYLSIDENKEKWKKKITSLSVGSNAHHFRFADGLNFIKEVGIPSVPRYILIGADGQIISFNAPRPRSTEIRDLISKYEQ